MPRSYLRTYRKLEKVFEGLFVLVNSFVMCLVIIPLYNDLWCREMQNEVDLLHFIGMDSMLLCQSCVSTVKNVKNFIFPKVTY